MFVDLDFQIGLAGHDVFEEVLDEGIRAAAEIGDIDAVEPLVLPNKLGGPEDLLAITPVHGLDVVQFIHLIQGQEVQGHGQDPQLPEFPVQIEVHAGVQGIVRPADDDHETAVGGERVHDFPASGHQPFAVSPLGRLAPADGLVQAEG